MATTQPLARHPAAGRNLALLPIMAAVLTGFLVVGIGLPVLPLHVHGGLGFGAFVVGLVTGSQFAVAVVSRLWAGRYADARGARRAVILGLSAAPAAGLLYLLSLALMDAPVLSVAVLLAGRLLLGAAESFIITGAILWGLALVGTEGAGKVIAWVGMAMFAALALGGPIGTGLYEAGGFVTVALATTVLPLAALALAALLPAVPPQRGERAPLRSVLGSVWLSGLGAALGSMGLGAIIAFGSLVFAERGWRPLWLPFTAFAISLIAARILLGNAPDRFGGARVALVCALIEAVGLVLVWLAPGVEAATLGTVLAGAGCSLIYPGFGVEAVRRAPPESRGLAMGAYTAFLDVALGFGTPAVGLIAGWAGLGSVFAASALIVVGAAPVAARLFIPPTGHRRA